MPPSTFGAICKGLGEAKLNAKPARVVMEKPLGTSLATSQEINDQVGEYFEECQVYRIDHYLGKETVLNLLALRFANSLFVITGTIAPLIMLRLPWQKKWGSKGAGAI
ncbi:glucose-6-phosphate dehydrogenase [Escherichia coli]|nr:glucose-6-phosphate dehydrogenase [Escherichia coli]